MSIIKAFENLFNAAYKGQDSKRDLQILLDKYFPSDNDQWTVATYRDLETLSKISYESCRTVDTRFKTTLKQFRDSKTHIQEFTTFRSTIQQSYDEVARLGNFVSLETLRNSLGNDRWAIGIFALGSLIGLPVNVKILSPGNGHGYIVPIHITKKQLKDSIAVAKREATHYGSVFPYRKLMAMPEWEFIPPEHRKRFAQELLSGMDGFLELGDREYFGFSNISRDRIQSRLIKIFSVYDEIPAGILVKTLYRTLKSKNDVNKSILEECADVYDEYCLQAGYCIDKGDLILIASPKLQALVKHNPPADSERMYAVEKALVSALRRNGAPMDTNSFIPVMVEHHANQSYVMEFATLIYREGWRYNSSYHTLDDRYGQIGSNSQESHKVDRKRIEINRINRDNHLSRKVKRLCKHRCQICSERIQIGDDSYYSEVHHIQPIGQPHYGPDDLGNLLCVCPNDHVMLDYGVIPLDITKLYFLEENPIAEVFVNYHNNNIYRRQE